MSKTLLALAALLGALGFLAMVKLMYDMTGHMARMTDQVVVMSTEVGRMRAELSTLVGQVGGIEASVRHMGALATDVRGIRDNVGTMATVIDRGGQQIERVNPAGIMERMLPMQR